MRAVVQRVTSASVTVDSTVVGVIGAGLLVLLGVAPDDTHAITEKLADKVAALRIFSDDAGKFNHDVRERGGKVLVVSQFTLFADTRRGNRPSFLEAASPDVATVLVDAFAARLRVAGLDVANGVFGAHMEVALVNDGPVTIILDSDDWQRSRRS
jgi:D-tyrosyl-tRNA(Tyr) deacylase